MVALECLFIAGERYDKGGHIARRLSERFTVNELTVDEQPDWLQRLYWARNDAVYEGRSPTTSTWIAWPSSATTSCGT